MIINYDDVDGKSKSTLACNTSDVDDQLIGASALPYDPPPPYTVIEVDEGKPLKLASPSK
jgi:hypothetical protein